ncbi:MAG: Calx-beta domain-containing protein [Thalassotalea sp.]|nr:Calx-beta domain-containing protein [Thalassotalea sp.]
MRRIIATVLFTTLPLTSLANDLFQWSQTKAASHPSAQLMENKAYKSGKVFSINTAILKKYKVNDSITLNISSDESYLAKITKIKHKENGVQHIIAEIHHRGEKMPVVMTLGEKQFFFRIVTENNVLVAQGLNGQGKLINEQSLAKASNINDVKIPQQSEQLQPHSKQYKLQQNQLNEINNSQVDSDIHTFESLSRLQKIQSNLTSINKQKTSDEMVTVSVLFVYSLSAETLYQGDVTTRLNHLVEVTNQIYIDSEVNMQIEIADTLVVDYPDEILSEQALDDITYQSHEAFTNIENIRFEAGADMVALLRPNMDADTVCGIAWGNSEVNNSINYMYSHTSIDCPDYVNAHEMGHNMGLAHSLDQGDEGYSFPFARGYRVSDPDNGFSTVMAYSTSNAGKVYKFSNPNVLCTELACGIDKSDTVNGADASYALNQLRFQLSNIMDSEASLTLAIDALDNIVNTRLKSCLENQINNNDITYAAQIRSLYCSYQSISTLEGIESFSGLIYMYLDGNNLTDISPLASLSKLSTISLSDSNISDLSPLSSITYLNNLTLTGNQISSLNGLENLNFLTYLNISDNKITDISAISSNTALETIILDNNLIADITPLQKLVNINWLSLNQNKITQIPSLSQLTKVTNLNITNNVLANINGVSHLRKLEYLDIENTNTSDLLPIKSLINLKTFSLGNNPVTNIEPLIYLYNLENVYASNTNFSDILAVFNLHNSWSQINFAENNNIYCWQLDYITSFIEHDYYQKPTICDSSTDASDADNDGVTNSTEIANNSNPLYNSEQAGKLEFQIDQLSLNEADQTIELKVIRTTGNMGEVKVDVRTNDQIAVAGEDFTAINQTLTLANNELYKTFHIDIIGDLIYENNETFEIELLNLESATLGDKPSLTVTLQDQGGAALTWLETSNEVVENANTLTLSVIRPEDSIGEMSVDINYVDGIAINGTDYIFENQTITFLEGEYSKEIEVVILDNDEYQENRSFSLIMSNPFNAYIENNTQITTIEIIDDDIPPSGVIAFETNTLSFNENSGDVTLTLLRTNGEFGDLVINYNVTDITTTQGSDFTLTNGELTFLTGEVEKTITLSITDDNSDENDETFSISISADNASIIGEIDEITISIIDNDETVVTPPTTPTTPSDSGSGGGGGSMYYLLLLLISTQLYLSRKV